MYIKENPVQKHYEIWIPYSHKAFYKSMPQYQTLLEQAKNTGYSVCVYLGGCAPLLPNITFLLQQQLIPKIS